MTEPDVALTDFALTLECCALAARVTPARIADPWQRSGARLMFGATALATLVGGITHGFLSKAPGRVQDGMWLIIFAAAGLASLGCWVIGSSALFPRRAARDVNLVGVVLFLVYLVSALASIQSFLSVLLATVAAAAMLLAAFAVASFGRHRSLGLLGIVALVLVFAGSLVQRSGLDIHPRFTHDALYHVILGVALLLLAVGLPALDTARDVRHGRIPRPTDS